MHRLVVFLCILSFAGAFAQTSQKQKQLEKQKKALLEQIQEMSALRSQQAQERKSLAFQIEEISEKISARTQLIRLTNHQANLLSQQIKDNQNQISTLKKDLQSLKKNYAAGILQSYKSRSPQSRWMFLLASESFTQGYKRLKYLQQYTQYRKKQAQEIQQKNTLLQQLADSLSSQYNHQRRIVEENQKEQTRLSQELLLQARLLPLPLPVIRSLTLLLRGKRFPRTSKPIRVSSFGLSNEGTSHKGSVPMMILCILTLSIIIMVSLLWRPEGLMLAVSSMGKYPRSSPSLEETRRYRCDMGILLPFIITSLRYMSVRGKRSLPRLPWGRFLPIARDVPK